MTPKAEKSAKISQNQCFLKNVENRALHVEMAYFTLSEDPDSHFIVKMAISGV